jgi:hypothetical protein
MIDVMLNLFDTYLSLYKIAIIICLFGFWTVLSFMDKTHIRERSRHVGMYIYKYLVKIPLLGSRYDIVRIIVLRPLCIVTESFAGFLEGVENFEPILTITELQKDVIAKSSEILPATPRGLINVESNVSQSPYHNITTKDNVILSLMTNQNQENDASLNDSKNNEKIRKEIDRLKDTDSNSDHTQHKRRDMIHTVDPITSQRKVGIDILMDSVTEDKNNKIKISQIPNSETVSETVSHKVHDDINKNGLLCDIDDDDDSSDENSDDLCSKDTKEAADSSNSTKSKSTTSTDSNTKKDSSKQDDVRPDNRSNNKQHPQIKNRSEQQNDKTVLVKIDVSNEKKTGDLIDSKTNDRNTFVRDTMYTQTLDRSSLNKSKQPNNEDTDSNDEAKNEKSDNEVKKRRKIPIRLVRKRFEIQGKITSKNND